MNTKLKKLILTGGVLNSLFALFHIYLAYQIFKVYSGETFYPLMQMLNVGGSVMIFYFAYSSLAFAGELTNSKLGRSIILLNVILYTVRIFGEYILFPLPKIAIAAVCLVMVILYTFIYTSSKKVIS